MSTVAGTSVTSVAVGLHQRNWEIFEATISAAAAADTLTLTLPARWQGVSCAVASLICEQWSTADAGARTKTNVPVTFTSLVEATGVISVLVGATAINASGGGKLRVKVVPSPLNQF